MNTSPELTPLATQQWQAVINKYYPEGTPLRHVLMTHSQQVCQRALAIANALNPGIPPENITAAAMMHDVGICLVDAPAIHCHGTRPYIMHGLLGKQLLQTEGMPQWLGEICARHTGAGITPADIEAQNLPLPPGDYMPRTTLQRLICYADKFYSKTRLGQTKTLDQVRQSMLRLGNQSLERFNALASEFNCL